MNKRVLSAVFIAIMGLSFTSAQEAPKPFSWTWSILSQPLFRSDAHVNYVLEAGSGDGLYASKTFDEVWAATREALSKNYEIRDSDKDSGRMLAYGGAILDVHVEERRGGIGVNIDVGGDKRIPVQERAPIYKPLFEDIAARLSGGAEIGPAAGGPSNAAVEPGQVDEFGKGAIRLRGDIGPPQLIKYVAPVYPENARRAYIEGAVVVEAVADERGRVLDVRVVRSIPALDKAALDAVKKWKFKPMVVDGKPRRIIFNVTVHFKRT